NPWLTATTRNTLNTIAPGTIEFVRTLAVAWCSYSTVLQSRNWLPDGIGGLLWYGVDNPGQSPRIPIFAGGNKLPKAFDFCGQKQYKADCILWQFRRANRLGTVEWQTNKKLFDDAILKIEDLGFDGLAQLEADYSNAENKPDVLDAYTAKVYEAAAATWQKLEEDLWHKHGRGF
ncbi:MAG: C69 family dipeptidase, partial [Bacteroidales bacterium]|nr:C69 family dipeptidase [Bacteroidales bacterium]